MGLSLPHCAGPVFSKHRRSDPALPICIAWLLFALLFRSTQPKFPGFWPILAAYIVGTTAIFLVDPADLLMGCVLLIGLLAVGTAEARTAWLSAVALGVIAGLGLLLKFSVGILSLWVAVNVVASAARWKSAAIAGAVSLPGVPFWSYGSQRETRREICPSTCACQVPPQKGSLERCPTRPGGTTSGFTQGLSSVCLGRVSVVWATERPIRRVQVCTVLMFSGFTWVAFKEGFVPP